MKKCAPEEISLKSYFLGPQAENTFFLSSAFLELLNQYSRWRQSLFPTDGNAISQTDQTHPLFLKNQKQLHLLISQLSKDFQNEIPHFSARYLGHMFSEHSLPGLLGHLVALLHNPNNISHESSHVGLKIEGDAVQALCEIFGWKGGTGHLTSGGTVANLEGLLRMRSQIPKDQWPQMKLLTSSAAHYSWKKNMKIMGLGDSALIEVPLDSQGRMSVTALASLLQKIKDPILGVVSLFGSTERGTVDDIAAINQILKKHRRKKIWHHVDAAYGGFFACVQKKKRNLSLESNDRAKNCR
jgi:glutamate/tyrosine decarboxylase-like PLP-dependent enzyme